MTLFPPTPAEQRIADVQAIRKCLQTERAMREKVFQHNDRARIAKVAEIDQALEALARLERRCPMAQVGDFAYKVVITNPSGHKFVRWCYSLAEAEEVRAEEEARGRRVEIIEGRD